MCVLDPITSSYRWQFDILFKGIYNSSRREPWAGENSCYSLSNPFGCFWFVYFCVLFSFILILIIKAPQVILFCTDKGWLSIVKLVHFNSSTEIILLYYSHKTHLLETQLTDDTTGVTVIVGTETWLAHEQTDFIYLPYSLNSVSY